MSRATTKTPVQISVKEASRRLHLTERTILNFIKLRRVDAVKVGKEWFIDYPSFISFIQRYNFKDFTETTESLSANPTEAYLNEKELKHDMQLQTNLEIIKANPSPRATPFISKNNSPGPNFKSETKPKEVKPGLSSLRVFQHCAQLFETENFIKQPSHDYEKRVRELSFLTLEDLGAGYHSFGVPMKLKHYSQARCHLGAILALVLQNDERRSNWYKEKEEIESHILPAFTALLRKIERRPTPRITGEA